MSDTLPTRSRHREGKAVCGVSFDLRMKDQASATRTKEVKDKGREGGREGGRAGDVPSICAAPVIMFLT